jgi:hypothetical protein
MVSKNYRFSEAGSKPLGYLIFSLPAANIELRNFSISLLDTMLKNQILKLTVS